MSIIKNLNTSNNDDNGLKVNHLTPDSHTSDDLLKYKLRSINLIKHNPNLFVNRGSFINVIGGEKTLITTLGLGVFAFLYRNRMNSARGIPIREGVWYSTIFFLYGSAIGAFYSCCYFMPLQVVLNEYFAHFLLKRYKGSGELSRHDIYRLRDVENTDECYVFTNSYANNFHM
jgi:hypothetical protein